MFHIAVFPHLKNSKIYNESEGNMTCVAGQDMKLDLEFDPKTVLSLSLRSERVSPCSRAVQGLTLRQVHSVTWLSGRAGGPGKVHRLGKPASVLPDFCASDTIIKLDGISAYVEV
jgi:hypothetical protein